MSRRGDRLRLHCVPITARREESHVLYPSSYLVLDLHQPPTPRRRYDNGVVISLSPRLPWLRSLGSSRLSQKRQRVSVTSKLESCRPTGSPDSSSRREP